MYIQLLRSRINYDTMVLSRVHKQMYNCWYFVKNDLQQWYSTFKGIIQAREQLPMVYLSPIQSTMIHHDGMVLLRAKKRQIAQGCASYPLETAPDYEDIQNMQRESTSKQNSVKQHIFIPSSDSVCYRSLDHWKDKDTNMYWVE